jgi:hypothetical protein
MSFHAVLTVIKLNLRVRLRCLKFLIHSLNRFMNRLSYCQSRYRCIGVYSYNVEETYA